MLMLLTVHVTSVLFLVRFNNFALTMGPSLFKFISLFLSYTIDYRPMKKGLETPQIYPLTSLPGTRVHMGFYWSYTLLL